MSDPYLGEIKIVAFSFPPRHWAACDGQTLQITQNQGLFFLLGTMYGGDGSLTFRLPDLRGRVPVHVGGGISHGETAGEQAHTIIMSEMPSHTHTAVGSTAAGDTPAPAGAILAAGTMYGSPSVNAAALTAGTVAAVGGSQPHSNMQPYLTLMFCIALAGDFPARN